MLLLSLVLLWLLAFLCVKKSVIEAYFISIIVWMTWMLLTTEFLSVEECLDKMHTFISWVLFDVCMLALLAIVCAKNRADISGLAAKLKHLKWSETVYKIKQNKTGGLFIFYSVFLIVLAYFTVPYNWDSMTYHLTRIMHWIQNSSIAHYATNDVRQITSPPLAEFVNLQVMLMHGKSDRLVNILQCSSYITNTYIIYAICQKLHLRKLYTNISCLLFVSMPIAFSEALTTQVDEFSTLWLLIFVYFLIDFLDKEKKLSWSKTTIVSIIIMAACIGFGYLTKPSIMFAILFFLLGLLMICLKRHDDIKIVFSMILFAGIAVGMIVVVEIIRNLMTFHAISAPIAGARQLVGTINPRYVFVNGLKNLTYNLPNIYFYMGTAVLTKIVYAIAGLLKVNINDISISEDGREFFLHNAQNYGHDTALNPIIVMGCLLAFVYMLYEHVRKNREADLLDLYTICSCIAFFVFCMVLRWEPFVSRYMLGYLAVLCPAVGGQLQKFRHCNVKIQSIIVHVICFMCCVELVGLSYYHLEICFNQNVNKRNEGYYINRNDIMEEYFDLISVLQLEKGSKIGLYLGGDSYEYPLWAGLKDSVARMDAVCVQNESLIYSDERFIPEYIISDNLDKQELEYNKGIYRLRKQFGDKLVLLERVEK